MISRFICLGLRRLSSPRISLSFKAKGQCQMVHGIPLPEGHHQHLLPQMMQSHQHTTTKIAHLFLSLLFFIIYLFNLMFFTLIHLMRNPLWENVGLHESPLEQTCSRCYIWNKTIADRWPLPIQCCVLVNSPIQDLHSFLHSLEVQTDPVLSV